MIIDVSEFNVVTDWKKVKKNTEGVIIRMGYRGSVEGKPAYKKITEDKKYREYRKACEDNGVVHGFYYFPTGITEKEVEEEADWVIKELKGISTWYFPVFADSELVAGGKGRADNLSKETRTRLLQVFCDRLQSRGIPSGIYASTNWLIHNLDMSKLPYSVWVAQYAPTCKYEGEYVLWQYSSSALVDGVSGRVDASVRHQVGEKPKEEPVNYYGAKKVIDIALSEVGYVEKRTGDLKYLFDKTANAGANNYTKYGYEMHNLQPRNMDYPAAWCDAFVDWCFMKAYGVSNAKALLGGDFDDYTVFSANLYKKKNAWYSSPRAGDQIFFKNTTGICHTGLVIRVENGYVYTVEGNTSSEVGVVANGGCVRVKSYPVNYYKIAGYGRPNYSQTAVETPPPKVDTSNYPTIKKGSARKDYVLLLQNALTLRGYPLEIDGIFGSDTEKKVKAFQKDHRISVDGIVGPVTWKTLFA